MVDGVQSCSAMAQGGRKFNTFKTLVPLPIFLFFFCSILFHPSFLFCPDTGKEVRIEWQMGARVTASFEPRNIGGQATEPSQT
jgi:hypothetical protein